MMSSIPECWVAGTGDGKVSYDGEWGESYFNYRKQVLIWNFVFFIISTVLWFVINECARLVAKEYLPELLQGVSFWIAIIVTIGLCMSFNGWLSDVMIDHIHMKVKRYQIRQLGKNNSE